jgi:hypothetical protein
METVSLMNISALTTFTVILRPPVTAQGRSCRWSGHCLDLDLGVSATSASEVRRRVAASIAEFISTTDAAPQQVKSRKGSSDKSLWDIAYASPIITRQTIETDAGLIEVRYVQPQDQTSAS